MEVNYSERTKDALKRAKVLKELKLQCPEWQAWKAKWSLIPVPQRTSEQWNEYVEDATRAKNALDALEAERGLVR